MSLLSHLFFGLALFVAGIFGSLIGATSTPQFSNPPVVHSSIDTGQTSQGAVQEITHRGTTAQNTSKDTNWIPAPAASTTDSNVNYGFTQYGGAILYNAAPRTDIDTKTFLVWGIKSSDSYVIGRDKNCVYFENNARCENVDLATFTPLGSGMQYAKDKNYAYVLKGVVSQVPIEGRPDVYNTKDTLTYVPIDGADLGSFVLVPDPYTSKNISLSESYAKDAHTVYMAGQSIVGADPNAFEILGPVVGLDTGVYENQFEQDKDHVYCGSTVIAGLNPDNIMQSTSTPGVVITLTKEQSDACFPPITGQY